jgi:hypothetical protein
MGSRNSAATEVKVAAQVIFIPPVQRCLFAQPSPPSKLLPPVSLNLKRNFPGAAAREGQGGEGSGSGAAATRHVYPPSR